MIDSTKIKYMKSITTSFAKISLSLIHYIKSVDKFKTISKLYTGN